MRPRLVRLPAMTLRRSSIAVSLLLGLLLAASGGAAEGAAASGVSGAGTVPCSSLPELQHLALRVAILGNCRCVLCIFVHDICQVIRQWGPGTSWMYPWVTDSGGVPCGGVLPAVSRPAAARKATKGQQLAGVGACLHPLRISCISSP